MWCALLVLNVGMALANYGAQQSGYETAEQVQPAPAYPPSSDGGDQQGYNTDGKQSDTSNSGIANDAPKYGPGGSGGKGGSGGFPGVNTPGVSVNVPGVGTPDMAGPTQVAP
ncbi:unnamed protein product, partial [Nippostrongylus brasiliensis]|uniref:Secreted protein n=1 Tax=Nippostrongylus brasiliensis TaxID=27835 RepID=A0A0N4XW94_NIPBR